MNDELASYFSADTSSHFLLENISCDFCKSFSNQKIILGKTVCYIVGAVLINDQNEFLLIQEAKASCRGTWYLPAGRVEPNETLYDSVVREVLEESGLIMKPTGLVCLEESGGRWIRFIFAGEVAGGKLKTLKQADSESLQAAWFKDFKSIKLRSQDILLAVQNAKSYYDKIQLCKRILPTLSSHRYLLIRSLILQETDDLALHVLLKLKESYSSIDNYASVPVSCFNLHDSIGSAINYVIEELLVDLKMCKVEICGVLRVEHSGNSNNEFDGICLTVLVNLLDSERKKKLLPKVKPNLAVWHQLDLSLLPHFESINNLKKMCTPIISFH